ncbi:MAG: bile acid:sodium symporter [Comamonas sp.]|nr:bile acid:sodium symporter [Comamonas sp.]
MSIAARLRPDNFTLALASTVLLASLLPASGQFANALEKITNGVIVLLFFLHGSKLSRQAIWTGIKHWRLHLLVTATTFLFFPLLGWLLQPMLNHLLPQELVLGVLFLCTLPATVQSAIALTALARGNVPAAVCSASGSTLMGIFFTPFLAGILLSSSAHIDITLDAFVKIAMQLLLPFAAGHLLRPWTEKTLQQLGSKIKIVDQGSILLVVYTAFSGAVIAGLWQQMPWIAMLGLFAVCALILACSMGWCIWSSRRLHLSSTDEATVLFCGAQKSLVSGIPMAQVLFSAAMVGPMVLPVMLFHPMQLMVSAAIAARYGRRQDSPQI